MQDIRDYQKLFLDNDVAEFIKYDHDCDNNVIRNELLWLFVFARISAMTSAPKSLKDVNIIEALNKEYYNQLKRNYWIFNSSMENYLVDLSDHLKAYSEVDSFPPLLAEHQRIFRQAFAKYVNSKEDNMLRSAYSKYMWHVGNFEITTRRMIELVGDGKMSI